MSTQKSQTNGTAEKSKGSNGKTTVSTTVTLPAKPEEPTKPEVKGDESDGTGAAAATRPQETKVPEPSVQGLTIPGDLLSDQPPIEDRILLVQQLSDLVERRGKLVESLKKLKSLNTASENRELKITIKDGKEDWSTFQSEAVTLCIETLVKTLEAKIKALDEQITF